MQDQRGLYYYPDPTDVKTRVYVRPSSLAADRVEFRVWRQDHPEVWDRHPWLDYEAIRAMAGKYAEQSAGRTPLALYDIDVARVLIRDADIFSKENNRRSRES